MSEIEIWYTDDLTAEYGFTSRIPQYRLVHEYTVDWDDPLAACNEAFVLFNRDSGRTDPMLDLKKLRSLSMGDIVKMIASDGTVTIHVCATAGWRPVESFQVMA